METAKIFSNGNSQAVRLPKSCRFKDRSVYIKKFDDIVIIFPQKSSWQPLLNSLEKFTDDFMESRNQPAPQKRNNIK